MRLFGPNIEKMTLAGDIQGLIKIMLEYKDASLQREAGVGLVVIGEPARKVFTTLLFATQSRDLLLALGMIGGPFAIDSIMYNPRLIFQKWPAETVQALKPYSGLAVDPLIARIVHKDWHERETAVTILGKLGNARAGRPLSDMLSTERDERVRLAIVRALEELGDKNAIPSLTKTLKDKDREVSKAAGRALNKLGWQPDDKQQAIYAVASQNWELVVRIGTAAVATLIETIKDVKTDMSVRWEAVQALGKIGDKRAVVPLIDALEDDIIGHSAAFALTHFKDEGVIEPLIIVLSNKKNRNRGSMAVALGELRAAQAVEPLVTVLTDGDEKLRLDASRALQKILTYAAAEVALDDLRRVERLIDVTGTKTKERTISVLGETETYTETVTIVDYSRLRQLAHQELLSRGQ